MKIVKLCENELPEGISFCPDESIFPPPVKVQGGEKRALGDMLLIQSGGRYKLYTGTQDYVRVIEGKGHIKWARGEVPFSEGDILLLDGVKEYELNGRGRYCIVRR